MQLDQLLHLDGARQVQIKNLEFSGAARTFMLTDEPLLRSDWTIFRGGAVMITQSENCTTWNRIMAVKRERSLVW